MSKLLPLYGKYSHTNVIIDEENFNFLSQFKWTKHKKNDYVWRWNYETKKRIYIHQVIMNFKSGKTQVIDHLNRNPLDNRKSNLRICTQSRNVQNTLRTGKNLIRKYRGVTHKKSGKYSAGIFCNGRHHHLGTYPNEKDAAMAYDNAAINLFGTFACTNFSEKERYDAESLKHINSTGYKNINKSKYNKYTVRFMKNGKNIFYEKFNSLEDAVKCRDTIKQKLVQL